jgi:hypothetical protein
MVGRSAAAACAAAALAAVLTSAGAAQVRAQPVASAAGSCNLAGHYRSLGPTYVEQLSVSHTSCATGMSVIKAYNHCRLASGGVKGYCHSRVLGFRCTEKRPQTSPIQFIAKTHCTAGIKAVTFTYSENT